MRTTHDPDLNATVTHDDAGRIRGINLKDYRQVEQPSGREAAAAYIREIAERLNITREELRNLNEPVSYLDPRPQRTEYRLSEEKPLFDSATYAYYQTCLNTPVWAAGITVTLKLAAAPRVISATNTSEYDADPAMPSADAIERYRRLFATADQAYDSPSRPPAKGSRSAAAGPGLLEEILGTSDKGARGTAVPQPAPRLNRGRFFVYRFDPAKRTTDHRHQPHRSDPQEPATTRDADEALCGTPPTLPLPPVPGPIEPGRWYVVAELMVAWPWQGSPMNWRLLVEIETNTILYARALASGVNGLVFSSDPITSSGTATNTPNQGNAVLNPLRVDATLPNLNPPVAGTQSLQGSLVTVADVESPTVAAPTQPTGNDFDYQARTNDFAGVSTYYHNDRFFRLVESLGFPLATYFDGTAFPVQVDHRGFGSAGNPNAHCLGDGAGDGIGSASYGLADFGDTTNPIGIATDWRIILHELGGHGILYDHVSSANFGFSHSAGDSFAMIMNDYQSAWHTGGAIDRFLLVPFVPTIVRRSDRTVAAGWGWGGPNDDTGYSSEQILSTTMFRVYRSIGGDSTDVGRREFAARCMAYLMLRAVGTLTPLSNPSSPALFLTALLTADAGDWTSEGLFGGAYGKVFTWSFEKQNLNGGALPAIDVYIDDGRAGEYDYQPVFWETATVWNRHNPDGVTTHQDPAGTANYAYVRIKNRGTAVASGVVVKGYHCKPSAGAVWPGDLQPMTTAQLPAGTLQPNNTEEKIVGPFEWTPVSNAAGVDRIMMVVSATGDPSNVDNFTAGETVEDWRLVPNDNNIAVRNVVLVRLSLLIADTGDFGNVCVGSFKDEVLYLSNSGFKLITITGVSSSSAAFIVPSVLSYPLTIEPGTALEIPIRFQPGSFGPKSATITVTSSDPAGPKSIEVSGTAGAPRLAVIVADGGNFGKACRGSFVDEMMTLSNSGHCRLTITGITSSSPEFLAPGVLAFPIAVGAGAAVQVPVRFQPTSLGPKSAVMTITSDDPAGPRTVSVSGTAPAGKLAVTGSLCFGGVKACCRAERTLTICNVGECDLHVTSVAFKRKNPHWKLINNPFPATLHRGSCMGVVIRYKATEKCPVCCELVITTDDPDMPVKTLDVMAYTIWNECGCKKGHGDECKSCEPECGCGGADDCCQDEEEDEHRKH